MSKLKPFEDKYNFTHTTPNEFEINNPNISLTVFDQNNKIVYISINNSNNKAQKLKWIIIDMQQWNHLKINLLNLMNY